MSTTAATRVYKTSFGFFFGRYDFYNMVRNFPFVFPYITVKSANVELTDFRGSTKYGRYYVERA
jgi:hypothetical protein